MNPFYVPPEPPADEPQPGLEFVVHARRDLLATLGLVLSECGAHATVAPRPLSARQVYLTVWIPYLRVRDFKDRLWEEGLRLA